MWRRLLPSKILDRGAYRYWTNGRWVQGLRGEPSPVVSGGVGEVSVQYNPSLRQWLMIATNVFNKGIVLRQANSSVGPWSKARVIASGKNCPSIYGANIHPWSSGNDLCFTMSQWSSYNVYLMHATVTRVAVGGPRAQVPAIPLPGNARIPGGPAPDLASLDLRLPESMGGPAAPGRCVPRGQRRGLARSQVQSLVGIV